MANQNQKGPVFESQPGWGGRFNKWMGENFTKYVLPLLAALVIIIIIASRDASPQTNANPNVSPSSTVAAMTDESVMHEQVKAGDSYTLVARRAVSDYVGTMSDSLYTKGQRLYVETQLASKIKKESLLAGMTIDIKAQDIKDLFEQTKTLTAYQLKRWETYAKNVKF